MKIILLDRSTTQGKGEQLDYSPLRALGDLTSYETTNEEEIVERVADNDVVLVNALPLSGAIIRQLKDVKLIVKFGTGVDKIDLVAARERGIAVVNVPSYGSRAIAQWTLMLMLGAMGSAYSFAQAVRNDRWREDKFAFPIRELDGKTVGILGVGNIARALVKMLSGFDVRIIACTPSPKEDLPLEYVSLEVLAQCSDILSIHSVLNDQTRGLIGQEFIEKMKPEAYLVNTARAAIVEENALTRALQSQRIAGAAFDVFWEEPAPADHPLLALDNFILTPHVAWCSVATRQFLIDSLADKIGAFFRE